MGKILDFLKSLIPEPKIQVDKLEVNIDKRLIDNRKIIIKDSEIIYGNKVITDPRIIDKVFDKINEYKDAESLPFQLVHEELEEEYYGYEKVSIKDKESIALIKKVLPYEEVKCILMARRVVLGFDKDESLGKELLKQLDENYPKKGRKVYNLIGTKYFDEIILPFIEIFKAEKREDNYIEEFRKFYNEILVFFPLAIFVNNYTDKERIKKEITKRLGLDIPFIRIHTIGKINTEKVEEATKELEIEKSYTITNNKFNTSTGLKAQIYEIKLK